VSVAASIASFGVEQKQLVGLIANGTLPRSDQPLKVLPSRSLDQLTYLLEALAAVTAYATRELSASGGGIAQTPVGRDADRHLWHPVR